MTLVQTWHTTPSCTGAACSHHATLASQECCDRLLRVTAPFMLRRLKSDKDVIADLPDKVGRLLRCSQCRQVVCCVARAELTPRPVRLLCIVGRSSMMCTHS